MAIQRFDELNNLSDYFEPMAISKTEKKKRCDMALEFFDLFYLMFDEIRTFIESDITVNIDEIVETYGEKYKDVVDRYKDKVTEMYPFVGQYAYDIVLEIVETTMKHTTYEDPDEEEDIDYYFSMERAINIAKTESNTIGNTIEYEEAKASGKTVKTWITMGDNKVRDAHASVDGTTVSIDDPFEVNGYQMQYPHDMTAPADLIVNCRCSCEYS